MKHSRLLGANELLKEMTHFSDEGLSLTSWLFLGVDFAPFAISSDKEGEVTTVENTV